MMAKGHRKPDQPRRNRDQPLPGVQLVRVQRRKQRAKKRKKAHVITVVKNNKDIMKITVHGEFNIYF